MSLSRRELLTRATAALFVAPVAAVAAAEPLVDRWWSAAGATNDRLSNAIVILDADETTIEHDWPEIEADEFKGHVVDEVMESLKSRDMPFPRIELLGTAEHPDGTFVHLLLHHDGGMAETAWLLV